MAWPVPNIGDKPLSEPMLARFTDGYIRHVLGGDKPYTDHHMFPLFIYVSSIYLFIYLFIIYSFIHSFIHLLSYFSNPFREFVYFRYYSFIHVLFIYIFIHYLYCLFLFLKFSHAVHIRIRK